MRLELKNLTKKYGGMTALDHISVTFTPGIYGILGANGAGKSTMMNLLTDNISRTDGEILFDGIDILKLGKDFRRVLGYMPQQQGFYEHMTAQTFLYYMADLKAVPKKQAKAEIENLLMITNLADVRHKRVGGFSGGMKQRVLLAQALLGNPKVVILDEPTAGLDPKQRISIRNYISKIAFNKIVIIATHVVPDIEFIARDIIMLKKGVIVDNAPPHELTQKIEGKVWNVPCLESEVQSMQDKFRVTNIARDDESGDVLLRVLSEDMPTMTSKNVAPTLEDYYLYVFGDTVSTT